jgi:organic hydroperoxide reductase OsmC/OhrA
MSTLCACLRGDVMAIAAFPHHYLVSLSSDQLTGGARQPIHAGAPPEFGGRDDAWSPEHLLAGAALLCLKTTFEAFATRAALRVYDFHGHAVATLDKCQCGPVFTSIRLDVELETDAGDVARARELLEKAEQNCIISRALNVPVHVVSTFRVRPPHYVDRPTLARDALA